MSNPRNPRISARKQPKQARSTESVAIILQAAAQVLATSGASRFTTARVAEKAGVSVGTLYQYFPNKAAILFRLQSDEWQQTGDLLRGILEDSTMKPVERLRRLVHAFVLSECEEAQMRVALSDAAPLYRDAPEAKQARVSSSAAMQAFLAEALPHVPDATRSLAGEMISTTLKVVGKHYSESPRKPEDIARWSEAMADMFCAYLERVAGS